jgi:hypothetical protein
MELLHVLRRWPPADVSRWPIPPGNGACPLGTTPDAAAQYQAAQTPDRSPPSCRNLLLTKRAPLGSGALRMVAPSATPEQSLGFLSLASPSLRENPAPPTCWSTIPAPSRVGIEKAAITHRKPGCRGRKLAGSKPRDESPPWAGERPCRDSVGINRHGAVNESFIQEKD